MPRWIMSNILQIGITEVQRSIKHCRGDTLHARMMLSLNLVELLHESTMMGKDIPVVVENVINKLFQAVPGYDWGICGA